MAASALKKFLMVWDTISGHAEDFAAYKEEYPEGSASNPAVEAYRLQSMNREVCAQLGRSSGKLTSMLWSGGDSFCESSCRGQSKDEPSSASSFGQEQDGGRQRQLRSL